jgi:hypothetical protein
VRVFGIDVNRNRERNINDIFIKHIIDVVRTYFDFHDVQLSVWLRWNYAESCRGNVMWLTI